MTRTSLPRNMLMALAALPLGFSINRLTQTASPNPATKADMVLINGTIITSTPINAPESQ